MIRIDEWNPVGVPRLEPNAHTAATQVSRNLVVSAGPGAGKTELLAQRADFLLRTGTVPYPQRILAISFKVDAAGNLRDRVRSRSGGENAARLDSFTFHGFAKRLIDNYRPALTGEDALERDYRIDPKDRIVGKQITFDDMVPLAIEILRSNRYALGALRKTYSHVFLDEFQDATGHQYSLLKTAFLGGDAQLTAVGDDKQSIMGWAGALRGIMATFAKDFDAEALPLYQNFRSKPRIRRLQNRMVVDMDPAAAANPDDLAGDEGVVQVLKYKTDVEEAHAVADLVEGWIDDGTPPSEIAVLIRHSVDHVGASLFRELKSRGCAFRNEHHRQDLLSEPAGRLIFNFLRVIGGDQHPDAYSELSRMALQGAQDDNRYLERGSQLNAMLNRMRLAIRSGDIDRTDKDAWKSRVTELLKFVGRPALTALSPSYHQGTRLDDVVKDTFRAFWEEMETDGDPKAALDRLSDHDAVRVLTIHKCKGLEFEKVVVLGVEHELFWGDNVKSEFFVAVSRAKDELVLTHAQRRSQPRGAGRWRENRSPVTALLEYAKEG